MSNMQIAVRSIGLGLAALVAVGLATAQAQPAFSRKDVQIAGHFGKLEIGAQRSTSIGVGDFNGDGTPDLMIGSAGGLDLLLNTGSGNFGAPLHIADFVSCPLVVVDLNGDGRLDVLLPSTGNLSGHILFGRGDGTFSPPREVVGMLTAVAGDFNGDARADLLIHDGISLRVLLGNGDGTFRTGARIERGPALSETNQLAVADFNGDGYPDLAVNSRPSRYSVSIFLGRGDGTFQAAVSTPVNAGTLLVADLNGDRAPDLVCGFDILLGKGDGTFQPPRPYFTREDIVDVPIPFAAVDFDGDGRLDLAVGSLSLYAARNQVSIFRGRGDGTTSAPGDYTVGWEPYAGIAADLDGDGKPDLVTANLVSNSISILLSGGAGDPRRNRAVSAASGIAIVAPNSLATLTVSTGIRAAAGTPPLQWSARLGGIGLEIRDSNGLVYPAPLLYVDGNQINFYVLGVTALGEASLTIVRDTGTEQVGTMQVSTVAPGVFLATDYSLSPVAFLVRVQSDGSRAWQPLFECSGTNACSPVPVEMPASGSKAYLVFYGTGFRYWTSAHVKCSIAFEDLPIEYDFLSDQQDQFANAYTIPPGVDPIVVGLAFDRYSDIWQSLYVNPIAEIVLSVDGVLANRVVLRFSLPQPPCGWFGCL